MTHPNLRDLSLVGSVQDPAESPTQEGATVSNRSSAKPRRWEYRIPKIDPTISASVFAETRSKARYKAWLHVRDSWPDIQLMDINVYATPRVAA